MITNYTMIEVIFKIFLTDYTEMNHIPRIFYPVRDCMLVALKPFYPFFFPVGAA